MNVGIFLKQFKRSNQAIVDDIRHGNSTAFGAEPLRELLKLLPETDEVEKIRKFKGDASKLTMADAFFNLLIQLPSYSVRIQSMLLREEFPVSCESMKRDVKILRSATKELMHCEQLHTVLHLVLQAGNILNAGGYAGNAVGFKLSSLLSLADTKANKPGMNLLHFVALEAQKIDVELLEFPLQLSHIQAAARISVESLDGELQWLTSRTHSVEESVQKEAELQQQLSDFLQHANSLLGALRGARQLLRKESSELLDFFCEDHETFRLDDCFTIFHTFCSRFTNAVKENRERDAKEVAHRQRVQDQEEQKRHSWAGGEKLGRAFGSRCSSESNMSAAGCQHDELLVELLSPTPRPRSPRPLSPRPQSPRPRSPLYSTNTLLGRSGSLRRSRNSPCSSPSAVAERELGSFLEMALAEQEVAQQSKRATALPEHGFKSLGGSFTMLNQTGLSVSPLNRSPKDTNHATVTNLRPQVNEPAKSTTVDPTSDANQQSDNSTEGFCPQPTPLKQSSLSTEAINKADDEWMACSDEDFSVSAGKITVVLEKCSLVTELKVFDKAVSPMNQEVGKDLSQSEDNLQVLKLPNSLQQLRDAEKSVMQSSPSLKEEDEDKVVVWCVTGVCEANVLHTPTEENKSSSNSQKASSSRMPLEHQQDNEEPVPLPISSQPVPAPRCSDGSLPISSPGCPAEANSAEDENIVTEKLKQNHVATMSEQSAGVTSDNKALSCQMVDVSPSSKPSTKNQPTSKVQTTVRKPTAPNTSTSSGKTKPVRTLIKSENPDMRRVLPISRTSRSDPTQVKRPEKPPSNIRGLASSTVPFSRSTSNLHASTVQRGGRPAATTSSQRSSSHDTLNPKGRKDDKGSPGSTQEQNQNMQKKPLIRKTLKAKLQPEEKMCLSTLRALKGAGASVSAPVTPSHKASTSSASPLPGFARNTASSSFRQTPPTHTPSPPRSLSPHPSSEVTPKAASSANSRAFTRTRSQRVTGTSRLSVVLNTPSPLRGSQSIRSSPRSSLQDSLAPPKGQQRSNSSNVSKDSVKPARPTWR
ncbi:FH2 domain-containing protein 1-like isoform X2 [Gouania willdenowi]|nr:FH2 domain-containing protein 1-like isoform X2 [Gouania willdenowi]